MALPRSRDIACLLVVLLFVTRGGDARVSRRSLHPGVGPTGMSSYSADDSSHHSPSSGDPSHKDSAGGFLVRLLEAMRAERDHAIAAAVEPLVAAQTQQQEKLDSIRSELAGQESQLDGVSTRVTALEETLSSVRHELDDIHSLFERKLEPLEAQVQSQLDAADDRLHSMETRLDATESRLNATESQLKPEPALPDADHPRDCSDHLPGWPSGVSLLYPDRENPRSAVSGVCDMETDGGGWTVFQRRAEGRPQQDFFLDWAQYKEGFGELTGEFWWGLEKLHKLTSAQDRHYELRIDLYDFDGDHLHATYANFGVSSERDGYRLLGGHFTGGGAGDSLSDHFGHRFSTKDRDQDTGTSNCARTRKGGWWYHACHDSNLNGPYLAGRTPEDVYGVNWPTWRGWRYSLKKVEMKIRPISGDLY